MDLKWLDFLSISDNQVLIDGCEVDMTKTRLLFILLKG